MAKKTFSEVARNIISKKAKIKRHKAAVVAAGDWKEFISTQMNTPKSGHWYYNPKTGKMYRASAAGEYPAQRTPSGHPEAGFLDLLRIHAGSKDANIIRIYIYSGAEYSEWLEENRKLFSESKEEFFDIIREALRAAGGLS